MSEPTKFEYIKVGQADPRDPLIVPAIRTVDSIYLQITGDRVPFNTFYWDPRTQSYGNEEDS